MTYAVTTGPVGMQAIAETSVTQKHNLGTIVRAFDSTYGEGEFIYLTGVANTLVGSVVVYDSLIGATTLAAAGANLPRPVAIAMSANVASQYGWYQISGKAVAQKTASSIDPSVAIGISGTAGKIGATSTGNEIQGCLVGTVTATTTAATAGLIINRPHMMGRTAA